jgi:hypothetical protein
MAIFRDPTLSPACPAVLLPEHQAKLYDDVHEIDTDTGSGLSLIGESFESMDDSIFDGFDTMPSPVVFSGGFVDWEVPQQFEDDGVIERTTTCTWPGGPFRARPDGCPVEPCRIIVDLKNLTIKTHRRGALPSIPENEAIFTKTPWWKNCFFGYSAEWDFDMAL